MRFLEKYEILALLASGSVSTFLARDRTTQDEVVVHSFECPCSAGGEARDRTIFKRFSSLAPGPAGRLLDVGLDEATALAYIITHVPPAPALQDWIRAYRLSSTVKASPEERNTAGKNEAAQGNRIPTLSHTIGQSLSAGPSALSANQLIPSGPADSTSVAPKGEFTKLFEGIGAERRSNDQDRSSSATGSPDGTEDSSQRGSRLESGAAERFEPTHSARITNAAGFTELFILERKDGQPLGGSGAGAVDESVNSAPEHPGDFTREFLANATKADPNAGVEPDRNPSSAESAAQSLPVRLDLNASSTYGSTGYAEPPTDTPKNNTSDFTNFFRGPFDQPGVPGKLDSSFSDLTAREKPAGEFTRIFGAPNSQQQEFEQPEPEAPASPPGDFTNLFSRDTEKGARLGVTSRLNANPNPAQDLSKSTPVIAPVERSPAFKVENTSSTLAAPPLDMGLSSGTANFAPPGPPPERASAFSRGSVFPDATEVFKRPQSQSEDSGSQEVPSGPSEFTKFLSRRQINASLSAEPPLPPPAPRVTPMPAPPMPVPAMPKSPKPAAASSYWPLITVLTVLVAIATLLVMYFVMRH